MKRLHFFLFTMMLAVVATIAFLVIARDRAVQRQRATEVLMTALARLIKDSTISANKLPETLEDTREGSPWLDPCGEPIRYGIVDREKLIFSLSSRCGGNEQELIFQIEGNDLKSLR